MGCCQTNQGSDIVLLAKDYQVRKNYNYTLVKDIIDYTSASLLESSQKKTGFQPNFYTHELNLDDFEEIRRCYALVQSEDAEIDKKIDEINCEIHEVHTNINSLQESQENLERKIADLESFKNLSKDIEAYREKLSGLKDAKTGFKVQDSLVEGEDKTQEENQKSLRLLNIKALSFKQTLKTNIKNYIKSMDIHLESCMQTVLDSGITVKKRINQLQKLKHLEELNAYIKTLENDISRLLQHKNNILDDSDDSLENFEISLTS